MPTPAQAEAWLQQVEVLHTAAAIAQQWTEPALAEDLTWLAQMIRVRATGSAG